MGDGIMQRRLAMVVIGAVVGAGALVGGPVSAAPVGSTAAATATPPSPTVRLAMGGGGTGVERGFGCAITAAEGVACWGNGTGGALGSGAVLAGSSDGPINVVGLTDVRALTAGSGHACALDDGGAVWCWGVGSSGQLGNGSTTATQPTPVQVTGIGPVASIDAGQRETCAVTQDGAALCWGANGSGQVGDGTTTTALTPKPVAGLGAGVASVAVGGTHACALRTTGAVVCWGANTTGSIGNGTTASPVLSPTQVVGLTSGVDEIAAGSGFTCARSAGAVQCWGSNSSGQLGTGDGPGSTPPNRTTPSPVQGLVSGVVSIDAGGVNACARYGDASLMCWGGDGSAQIDGTLQETGLWYGSGNHYICGTFCFGPVRNWTRATPWSGGGTQVEEVRSGSASICVVAVSGHVRCSGSNDVGQLGAITLGSTTSKAVPDVGPVTQVSVGTSLSTAGQPNVCATRTDDKVWCWGWNTSNRDGSGSEAVSGATGVKEVSAGTKHTCAVTIAGGVVCWGSNTTGQLGRTASPSIGGQSGSALSVASLSSNVSRVAAGGDFSCALTTGGGVRCWGSNTDGRLGAGTAVPYSATPLDVVGLTSGVVALDVGVSHACAVTSGGEVKCWGYGYPGKLGTGSTASSNVPVTATGLSSGYVGVAAGADFSCAWTASGSMKCFGEGIQGALGRGSTGTSLVPVSVTGLAAAPVIGAHPGGQHMCVVQSGAARCWGNGSDGQIGDGGKDDELVPADVAGLGSGVSSIEAGDVNSCAVMTDQSLRCWGSNARGQLRLKYQEVPGLQFDLPPAMEGAPSVVPLGGGRVRVSWTAADGNGVPIIEYVVRAEPGSGALTSLASAGSADIVVPGDVTSTVVEGLDAEVPYTFTVHAVSERGAGPESLPSIASVPERPTSADLGCTPGSVATGNAVKCSVVVTDTGPDPMPPSGPVSFDAGTAPVSVIGGPCELEAVSDASSTCAVRIVTKAQAPQVNVTASYLGSADHATSADTASFAVGPCTGSGPVFFQAQMPDYTDGEALPPLGVGESFDIYVSCPASSHYLGGFMSQGSSFDPDNAVQFFETQTPADGSFEAHGVPTEDQVGTASSRLYIASAPVSSWDDPAVLWAQDYTREVTVGAGAGPGLLAKAAAFMATSEDEKPRLTVRLDPDSYPVIDRIGVMGPAARRLKEAVDATFSLSRSLDEPIEHGFDEAYVRAAYSTLANRGPTAAELARFSAQLDHGNATRVAVVEDIALGLGSGWVKLLPTTTTVSTSSAGSVFGQATTIKAKVAAVTPGGGAPQGIVDFYDGDTLLGSQTLSSGTAALSVKLPVGSHQLTVSYRGSASHLASTGALTQTVTVRAPR
jgi:alpha-tubulin suppressor-like RCC1 family protein